MLDYPLHHPFQTLGVILAAVALARGPGATLWRMSRGRASTGIPSPASGRPSRSFLGRVGNFLAGHFILMMISGFVGFNVLGAAIIFISVMVIRLGGGEAQMPEWVSLWARNASQEVRGALDEKKQAAKATVGDKLRGVIRKVTGDKSAPIDSDDFWGGPPDPSPSTETLQNETLAFDLMPSELKIAAFEAGVPIDLALLPDVIQRSYVPQQWYLVRLGRSTFWPTTRGQVDMYRVLWSTHPEETPELDAEGRAHVTRLSTSPKASGDDSACNRYFNRLSDAEKFAIFCGALRIKRPVPEGVFLVPGMTRDAQYYYFRMCSCTQWPMPEEMIESCKDAEFVGLQRQEADLQRKERERLKGFVESAKDKATDAASGLKDKASAAARKGATSLFWNAMGYK